MNRKQSAYVLRKMLRNTALTKDEHDAIVAERGRPLTLTDPIQRRTDVDRIAPDLSDPEWFGVQVKRRQIGDAA